MTAFRNGGAGGGAGAVRVLVHEGQASYLEAAVAKVSLFLDICLCYFCRHYCYSYNTTATTFSTLLVLVLLVLEVATLCGLILSGCSFRPPGVRHVASLEK